MPNIPTPEQYNKGLESKKIPTPEEYLKKKEPTISDGQESTSKVQELPQESVSNFRTVASPKDWYKETQKTKPERIAKEPVIEKFDTGVKADEEQFEQKVAEIYNTDVNPANRIDKFNKELLGLKLKYDPLIGKDENAITEYNKEATEKAELLGLQFKDGKVGLEASEQKYWQENYTRIWDDMLKEKAKNEKDSFAKSVLNKLGSGSGKDVMLTPYRVFKTSEKIWNAVVPSSMESQYWADFVNLNDDKFQEMSTEGDRYEQGAIDMLKSGDISGAVGNIALDVSESLPMLTTLVIGNAAGGTKSALGYMGASKGFAEYDRLDRNTELPEFVKITNALTKGLNEVVWEQWGTVKILDGVKKAVADKGRNQISKELAGAYYSKLDKAVSHLGAWSKDIKREALSEGATQLSDNIVDIASGLKPVEELFDQVGNSMLVGGVIGGGISLPAHIPTSDKSKYIRSVAKSVPEEFSTDSKIDIVKEVIKREEFDYKAKNTNNEGIKSAYEKIVKSSDQKIVDIIAKESGYEQDTEKKGSQLKQSEELAITKTDTGKEIKELTPEQKVYEDQLSKRTPEELAQLPTFRGKKFTMATVKPNGDISNVYLGGGEGKSHNQYMTPEDADLYEQGRLTIGVYSKRLGEFMEAPQKGVSFGNKVMKSAFSKVEEPINEKEQKTETGKVLEGETGRVQEPVTEPTKEVIKENIKPIKEPKKLKVTRIEGLGMGQSQAKGTYFSTEKKNRYGEPNKAKNLNIEVDNPIEFDQNKNEWPKYQKEILNSNTGKFNELDFEGAVIPNKITIDDLSKKGIDKLSELVTDDLQSKGYDAINFTGKGENEIVVFPTDDPLKSNNPQQIYEAYNEELINIPSKSLTPVEEIVLSRKINAESFKNFSDKNYITNTIAKSWFTKSDVKNNAGNLDVIADEISRMTGQEITPQDIVDIILKYPSARARKTTDQQNALRKKYKELTGQSIDTHELQKEAESEELTKEDNDWINEVPPERIKDLKGSVSEWQLTPENIDEYEWLFTNKDDFNDAKKLLNDELETERDTDISKETSEPVSKKSETEEGTKTRITLDKEITELKDQLSNAKKKKQEKIAEFNSRKGLFGDTKNETESATLFNAPTDLSQESLNKYIQPEENNITRLSEQIDKLESTKESKIKEASGQQKIKNNAETTRISPEAPSVEKVRDNGKQASSEVYLGEQGNAGVPTQERKISEEVKVTKTKEERLAKANSVEEMDALMDEGLYNQNDKDWVKKKYELGKQKKYYKTEEEINNKIEIESAKKSKSSGFVGIVPLDIFTSTKSKPDKSLFSKYKGLSKMASKQWQHKTGKVNSILYKGSYIAKDAIKAAKEVYNTKKLSDQQSKEILSVLENMGVNPDTRIEQLNKLPVGLRPHIEKMRNFIDELTTDIQKTGILSNDNEIKFDMNRGFYMTRTYQKNTNKNWTWENIPDKIKKQAAKTLLEYYPEATAGEIIGKLKGILEDKTFASYTTPNAPIGKMNLGITKSRSQFLTDNPEIREFLGENKDPFFNFTVSIAKMAELSERAKFLENVTEIGIKEGWLTPIQTEDMYISIDNKKIMGFGDSVTQSKAGKSFAPLGQYYTTPEIAQAFNTFNDGVRITNKALQWYMKGVSFVKKSKTAYSIGSQSRNLQSNLLNVIGNGNWNVIDTVPEIMNRLKNQSNKRDFISELKENVIIGDNVDTKAILKNIEEISGMMDNMYNENESGLAKGLKKLDRKALDLYTAGDDVFKVYRYVSEYSRYAKVYNKQGLSKEDSLAKAKNTATEILHDTSTYYSMLPKFMDKLRYMPFTGSFITFPYLTTMNVINTAKLSVKEMSNRDTFHIGLQRSTGMISSLSALGLYTMAINLMAGLDDEDIDDIRNALPSYWKNDMIAIQENNGEGKFTYANSSYLDYYNSITTPIWILERKYATNGDISDKDIKEALTEFISPYIQKDILFQKSINLLNNWDAEKKREVYNEGETLTNKIGVWNEYLWEAFEPATITDIKRTYSIYKEGEDWKKFGIGRLTGRQVREIDVVKSFDKYNVPNKKADFDNSIKIYKDALYEKGLSEKDKEAAKIRAEERLNDHVDELREIFTSYINVGADPEKLKEGLKYPGLDVDIVNAILYNNRVRLELGENGKTVSVKSIEE